MSRPPAFRCYPSDFWGSPDVQAMDLHEVGAYFSLLCNAWLSERPGMLPDDDEKLRRWARMTREQWAQSRSLLMAKFPLAEEGWRGNARLLIEFQKAQAFSDLQSQKGAKGGRPKGSKKPGLSFGEAGAFENESRGKAGEKPGKSHAHVKPSVSVSVSSEETTLQSFVAAWNDNRLSLGEIRGLTSKRKAKLRTRLSEGLTLDEFTQAVRMAAASPFCCGTNDRGWTLSFDWLVENDTNIVKVLEAKYSDKQSTAAPAQPAESALDRLRRNQGIALVGGSAA